MNTLSFFNPKFSSDFFDVIDRNFYGRCGNPEMPKRFVPKVDVKDGVQEQDKKIKDVIKTGMPILIQVKKDFLFRRRNIRDIHLRLYGLYCRFLHYFLYCFCRCFLCSFICKIFITYSQAV